MGEGRRKERGGAGRGKGEEAKRRRGRKGQGRKRGKRGKEKGRICPGSDPDNVKVCFFARGPPGERRKHVKEPPCRS